jgi:hypothetical protein
MQCCCVFLYFALVSRSLLLWHHVNLLLTIDYTLYGAPGRSALTILDIVFVFTVASKEPEEAPGPSR